MTCVAGNTFVLKSSEKSPLGTCAYGDLLNEAGFPPGVINILTGDGKVGSLLAHHMQVSKIAFTGQSLCPLVLLSAFAMLIAHQDLHQPEEQ